MQQRPKSIGEFFVMVKFTHREHDGMNQLMEEGLLSHLLIHSCSDDYFLGTGVAESILGNSLNVPDCPLKSCEGKGGSHSWFG